MISIVEIANGIQQIWTNALLIINNYILGLICGNDSIDLFYSHSNDENDNLSSSGVAVLLKFDMLCSQKNFITLVYYKAFPLALYFKVQFKKIHCTVNAKNDINNAFKNEQSSGRQEKYFFPKNKI